MVDLSKIKDGDKVELGGRYRVVRKNDENVRTILLDVDDGRAMWIPCSLIVAHYPAARKFKIGDNVVRFAAKTSVAFQVIGIYDDQLWIMNSTGAKFTEPASEMRHID